MSDVMTGIPFAQLLDWIRTEHKEKGSVFGVHSAYCAQPGRAQTIFGRKLETVVGPAAGPNSQLAQNIAASYYAGSRFFELKTVQVMDGAQLAACVNKPCIRAEDECYNCEWSTELYVPQAQEEYIKAWFLLAFLAKEYGLGDIDGFQFNISVGYDLKGIQSEKIDTFIETMKDAGQDAVFLSCKETLLAHAHEFTHMTAQDIEQISPKICNSVTLSTLHGCPPQEIENIASYLLDKKRMHTFIKCNPTLLGYEFARETLDAMGYDYLSFGRFHFEDDLQYADAIPMLQRLQRLSDGLGLEFGVKITNTFPVDVKAGELPSDEMYMSGKPLFPLSIALAAKLSGDFGGKLRIAYSGGADAFNIERIVQSGVWPVTVATTILKPGGYQRLKQIAQTLDQTGVGPFERIDAAALARLSQDAQSDPHHTKPAKLPSVRKTNEKVPLLNCYTAPCEDACPIHQDVSTYVRLAGEGRYEEAFHVILDKNALPFITGTICAHGCQGHCTRNFYETPVQIRAVKLECAQKAYDKVMDSFGAPKSVSGNGIRKKVAIVGGGPAGMAAAYYLARLGVSATIYEKQSRLGGIVSTVIPDFRIDQSVIDKDVSLLHKLGVTILTDTPAPPAAQLKESFDAVILAVGACERAKLELNGKEAVNALDFLEEFNRSKGTMEPGKQVVVIGGGNTAMDTARAAKRCRGVEHVYLVYRRTKRYMPADEHELALAIADGVEFKELLAPYKIEPGNLVCRKTKLGEADASGRAGVLETGQTVSVPADLVIAAVGERVPSDYYKANGIRTDSSGRAIVSEAFESSVPGVYVIGDGLYGPSLVVKAMAHAKAAAEAIAGAPADTQQGQMADVQDCYGKKGILAEPAGSGADFVKAEAKRCLSCSTVCENCVDVCPNRANLSIHVPGMEKAQVLHIDAMCNECGNCEVFCPYASAPYRDKFTLFASEADFEDSRNEGFFVRSAREGAVACKVRFLGETFEWKDGEPTRLVQGMQDLIKAVCRDYSYLLAHKMDAPAL